MIVWTLYDIENDSTRSKVSKICRKMGLIRVQYSVFLGTLNRSEKDSLELQIADLIDEERDKVYIFPMSRDELRDSVLLGQAFDKKLITNEVQALFL